MGYPLSSSPHWRSLRGLLVVLLFARHGLSAQTAESTAVTASAEGITAADVARHAGVLAQDSMQGRDTPSPSLERTAAYVAEQFTALGLVPLAGNSMIWRYTLPGRAAVDTLLSQFTFGVKVSAGQHQVLDEFGTPVWNIGRLKVATAVVLATDTVLDQRAPGAQGGGQGVLSLAGAFGPAPVVVAGLHTPATVRQANLHDKVVVYVPPAERDSVAQRDVIRLLAASNHVIVVVDEDSAAWATRRRAVQAHPPIVLDWYLPEAERLRRWAVYVWAPAIGSLLASAGVDLEEARAVRAPIVREVPGVALLRVVGAADAEPSAPNTVGVLPGEDSSRGVLVLTAHMDGVGLRRGRTDHPTGGVDDNTSGVVGLLALAKAFTRAAQLGGAPRRSIVFAAVSGGAKAFWGSSTLLDQWRGQPVLNINLDQIGRVVGDSVRINGLQEVELAVRPAWLAAEHPELGLAAVDGGSVVTAESDHFAFVRNAVPSLYVHGGTHGAEPGDVEVAAVVDAEQEARLLRFVFYLTRELANAPAAPLWTAEGRQARSRIFGH